MKNVTVTIKTKPQKFSGGEVDGPFTYSIRQGTNDAIQQKQTGTSATFNDVGPGAWGVSVSKLGVEITGTFSIDANDGVEFEVPASLEVTMVDSASTVAARASRR